MVASSVFLFESGDASLSPIRSELFPEDLFYHACIVSILLNLSLRPVFKDHLR